MFRKNLMIPLNYATFLYKNGNRNAASRHFTTFEHRMKEMKEKNDSEMDSDVRVTIASLIGW